MRLSWCKDACFALLFSMIMTAQSLMTTVSSLAYQARLRRDVMTLSAKIALTREVGGNDKLAKLLDGYSVYEIPCIMFASGDDSAKLPQAMSDHDVIVITSPQAAKVFLESWIIAGRPSGLNIATVGEGSSRPLITEGLIPFFEPSDSTAKTLAAEMPDIHGKKLLYPSSAIAENTLVEGLEERGFTVINHFRCYYCYCCSYYYYHHYYCCNGYWFCNYCCSYCYCHCYYCCCCCNLCLNFGYYCHKHCHYQYHCYCYCLHFCYY